MGTKGELMQVIVCSVICDQDGHYTEGQLAVKQDCFECPKQQKENGKRKIWNMLTFFCHVVARKLWSHT